MTTVTIPQTIKSTIDQANPNQLPSALQKVKLGTVLTPLKRTFTGLTAAAAFDLTAIDGTGETAGAGNPNRLPALSVTTLRVTAGTAVVGDRIVSDVGGTPTANVPATNPIGVATLSDDGKTITFEANATAFVITYVPRATEDLNNEFLNE